MSRSDLCEVEHYGIKHRTDKALLVDLGDREEWLPLSIVEDEDGETVTIPQWKVDELGIGENVVAVIPED